MYVITSEAALLLQIPHKRLLELLGKGRVKGSYKSGGFWLIPLYNGLPQIIPGKRGRKGTWVKTIRPKKTIIHVNRNRIQANKSKSPEKRKEVIAVKNSSSNLSQASQAKNGDFYTNYLEIPYPSC